MPSTRSQVAIAVPPHDGIAEVEQNVIRLQWHCKFHVADYDSHLSMWPWPKKQFRHCFFQNKSRSFGPRERHLQAVNRIIQCLKASPRKGLLFKKGGNLFMKIYTDADYAGSIVDRRPTTGYCMFLGENLVTWRRKKQNVVARSS